MQGWLVVILLVGLLVGLALSYFLSVGFVARSPTRPCIRLGTRNSKGRCGAGPSWRTRGRRASAAGCRGRAYPVTAAELYMRPLALPCRSTPKCWVRCHTYFPWPSWEPGAWEHPGGACGKTTQNGGGIRSSVRGGIGNDVPSRRPPLGPCGSPFYRLLQKQRERDTRARQAGALFDDRAIDVDNSRPAQKPASEAPSALAGDAARSQPPRQQRTNAWREATRPAR